VSDDDSALDDDATDDDATDDDSTDDDSSGDDDTTGDDDAAGDVDFSTDNIQFASGGSRQTSIQTTADGTVHVAYEDATYIKHAYCPTCAAN